MARKYPKSKPGVYKVEHVKKGRFTIGGIFTFEDGRRCFLAYRKLETIFKHGAMTISDAMRDNKAAWSFEIGIILQMRSKGIPIMGVLVEETGDLFLTKTEWLSDSTKARVINSKNGSALQRFMPLRYFWRRQGQTIIKAC